MIKSFYSCILILTLFCGSLLGDDKLSVHGYLTQAFGFSTKHQIHGLPKDGTSDYRNLAVQFRYDLDDKQNFIIQLSHERLGLSPTMYFEEDVELDWAYFEYKFTDNLSIKIGKIQLPFGIYNEIRDVGTLLPFYRIPFSPYGEGNYMSETLDGAVLKYNLELSLDWSLESKVFLGQWNWYEWANIPNPFGEGFITTYGIANVENAYGFQSWIFTPIEEIALGGGLIRGHVSNGLSFSDGGSIGSQDFYMAHVSVDASFRSAIFRTDYTYFRPDDAILNVALYHIQTGYNFTQKLSLFLQYENSNILDADVPSGQQAGYGSAYGDFKYYQGTSVSVKYDVFTYLTLKSEYHWCSGYAIEDRAVQFFLDDPYKTEYAIFSISTSF